MRLQHELDTTATRQVLHDLRNALDQTILHHFCSGSRCTSLAVWSQTCWRALQAPGGSLQAMNSRCAGSEAHKLHRRYMYTQRVTLFTCVWLCEVLMHARAHARKHR